MAYWFFKGKEYDPHPYSRLKKIWHWCIGCPIQSTEVTTDAKNEMCLLCSCGVTYCYEKK